MPDTMTAVETTALLDEHHRLQLDEQLPMSGPIRVRVIVMYPFGEEATGTSVPEVVEDLARDPDYAAYERERQMLESDHEGEYVAYCRGRRVALAASKREIFSLLDEQFPEDPCFVKHISREPRRITFRRPRRIQRQTSQIGRQEF